MAVWVCEQVGLSTDKVQEAAFGNRSRGAYSGFAYYSMRIHVSIGRGTSFPKKSHIYRGRKSEAYRSPAYADRLECLVGITAHEMTHLMEYDLKEKTGERRTMENERRVTELFRQSRKSLVAEWSAKEEATV